jgi:RNA polymerase sigma-70 factor (ECF subfamily)
MLGNTTAKLQRSLDLLRDGDDRGRTELCHHACERLRRLTRKMLRGYPLVGRWEQTDDVLQNAMIRLYRALAEVTPQSVRHFYNLAALQIRRELMDLAKHHARRDEPKADLRCAADKTGDEPSNLTEWGEFHRLVEQLPPKEQEVFALLWYHDLSQAEAAEVLGVSVRTVIRSWQAARIHLHQSLQGRAQK